MSSILRRSARIAARACSSTSIITSSSTPLTNLTLITSSNIIGSQLRPRPSVRAATAFFHPTPLTTRKPRRPAAARTVAPAVTAASTPVIDATALAPAAALSAPAPLVIDSGPTSLLNAEFVMYDNGHMSFGREHTASAPVVVAAAVGPAASFSAPAPPVVDSGPTSLLNAEFIMHDDGHMSFGREHLESTTETEESGEVPVPDNEAEYQAGLESIRNARHSGRAGAAGNGVPGPSTALQVAPTPVAPVTVQSRVNPEDEYPSDDEDEVIAIAPRVDYPSRSPRPRKRVTWADEVKPETALWRTGVRKGGADIYMLTPVTSVLENPLVWKSMEDWTSNWCGRFRCTQNPRSQRTQKTKLVFTDGIEVILRRTPAAMAGRHSAIKFLRMRQDDPRLTQKWGDMPRREQHIDHFALIQRRLNRDEQARQTGQPVASAPAPPPTITEERGFLSHKDANMFWVFADKRTAKGKLVPFMAASHITWRPI